MLTKDLLLFRTSKDNISPTFLSSSNQTILRIASELIAIYSQSKGKKRTDIEADVGPIMGKFSHLKTAKGFNKLLLDRCTFSPPEEVPYREKRAKIFRVAAEQLLQADQFSTLEDFRTKITESLNSSEPFSLYGDLPHNDQLTSFRDISSIDLVNRFNVALVQGLLFQASTIVCHTTETDAGNLRRVFKFMKFFRLLSYIYQEKNGLRFQIEGPLSVLSSSRKYGLQLASFFPALCLLPKWRLSCEVTIKKQIYHLNLTQDSGLRSTYRNLTAYIPEEVKAFAALFLKKCTAWSLSKETCPMHVGKGEMIFPDFTFVHGVSKTIVHLELFHRWHHHALLRRMDHCKQYPKLHLILGIDRFLHKKDAIASSLPSLGERYFLFSAYPSVPKVVKCLEAFLPSSPLLELEFSD